MNLTQAISDALTARAVGLGVDLKDAWEGERIVCLAERVTLSRRGASLTGGADAAVLDGQIVAQVYAGRPYELATETLALDLLHAPLAAPEGYTGRIEVMEWSEAFEEGGWFVGRIRLRFVGQKTF